ncbi:MAG: hypothetical protein EOP45_06805 [Sphingobacteriaceae bacterium]|nr:MAG: hypothetical protein EOP45_06805 [Sphingobacteriaceae bacterium]
MHRIFKNKEKICLVINAKDPEYYAGQRGFFYMLDFVCERYDMWAYPGLLEAKYSAHYNADFENWDPESAKWNYAGETEAEIIILNSHFRLTPETAMNTNHFTNMARQWAETIASEC